MLAEFWFWVIAVLWAGFFLLEGFDFGVGMLLPAVARNPDERGQALRCIGPVWDANEVWLIVAAGATFAAFPEWYASLLAGFYPAFALLVVALIVRGIGLEYRGKARTGRGRRWCEAGVAGGSLGAAALLGLVFAGMLRGVRLDAAHDVLGGPGDLLAPYPLLGAVAVVGVFALHGAAFLVLRTDGAVRDRARRVLVRGALAVVPVASAFAAWTVLHRGGTASALLGAAVVGALCAAAWAHRPALSFAATALASALLPLWFLAALWPDVLPARNGPALSLTLHAAASTPYTLRVMTVLAVVVMPVVLAYQAWTYWVFRARVTGRPVRLPAAVSRT